MCNKLATNFLIFWAPRAYPCLFITFSSNSYKLPFAVCNFSTYMIIGKICPPGYHSHPRFINWSLKIRHYLHKPLNHYRSFIRTKMMYILCTYWWQKYLQLFMSHESFRAFNLISLFLCGVLSRQKFLMRMLGRILEWCSFMPNW